MGAASRLPDGGISVFEGPLRNGRGTWPWQEGRRAESQGRQEGLSSARLTAELSSMQSQAPSSRHAARPSSCLPRARAVRQSVSSFLRRSPHYGGSWFVSTTDGI